MFQVSSTIARNSSVMARVKWVVAVPRGTESIDIGSVAKILKFLAEAGREVTVKELVKGARISFSTASKYIIFLEERGLVNVRGEGRSKRVRITEKGLQLLLDIQRVYSRLGLEL